MVRIMPNIPKIRARWKHRSFDIPEWLEVPMRNEMVVNYYPDIEHPAFKRSMELIQKMKSEVIGYPEKRPETVGAAPVSGEYVQIYTQGYFITERYQKAMDTEGLIEELRDRLQMLENRKTELSIEQAVIRDEIEKLKKSEGMKNG